MPIDFFIAPCVNVNGSCQIEGIVCKKNVSCFEFGICDDTPPPHLPAYIDLNNQENWIAIVDNPQAKNVTFKAIDNCVDLRRENGEMEKRCEGFLYYENKLIFLDLKNRKYSGWLIDAREKLVETISAFVENNNMETFAILESYVANKLVPSSTSNHQIEMEKFKSATGLKMKISRRIKIE